MMERVEEAMMDDARILCGAAVALCGRLKTGTAESAENAEKMLLCVLSELRG